MANPAPELLHGTLDALVLKTLAGGRRHCSAIAGAIEETTEEVVAVEEGSLYPALYRMEKKGWIEAEWGFQSLAGARSSTGSLRRAVGISRCKRPSGAALP